MRKIHALLFLSVLIVPGFLSAEVITADFIRPSVDWNSLESRWMIEQKIESAIRVQADLFNVPDSFFLPPKTTLMRNRIWPYVGASVYKIDQIIGHLKRRLERVGLSISKPILTLEFQQDRLSYNCDITITPPQSEDALNGAEICEINQLLKCIQFNDTLKHVSSYYSLIEYVIDQNQFNLMSIVYEDLHDLNRCFKAFNTFCRQNPIYFLKVLFANLYAAEHDLKNFAMLIKQDD